MLKKKEDKDISFVAFFLMWADLMGWDVPDFHIKIAYFLQTKGRRAVLMVFRGAAKSTIYAVYLTWRLYINRSYRTIVRGADDPTSLKLSSDTKNVLLKHPLTEPENMLTKRAGVEKFFF